MSWYEGGIADLKALRATRARCFRGVRSQMEQAATTNARKPSVAPSARGVWTCSRHGHLKESCYIFDCIAYYT
jgi:hypothetical protein